MKKIILLLMLTTVVSIGVNAQDTTSTKKRTKKEWVFRPYVSPCVSISAGAPSYGLEIGTYTVSNQVWIASTFETYQNFDTRKYDVLAGLRFYYRNVQITRDLTWFSNVAAKITCNNTKVLIFEPGQCLVFSPQKNIGIQWGFSFPISETITSSKVFPFSTGISFNVYM